MNQFRLTKDDYDAVFVGSSRVMRQLDPVAFDAVFHEQGHEMRSFSIASLGMRSLEAATITRWILARQPKRLRWIIIDCGDRPLDFLGGPELTERSIRIHTPRNLPVMLGLALSNPRANTALRWQAALRHVKETALNVLRLGSGRYPLARAAGITEASLPENRGFIPLETQQEIALTQELRNELLGRYAHLHNRLAAYERLIDRLRTTTAHGRETSPWEIELLRGLSREVTEHDAAVVLLIDASPRRRPNHVFAWESGAVEHLIRFDDPDEFPQLYDPDNRFDVHHLNRHGASMYSRLVAQKVLELPAQR